MFLRYLPNFTAHVIGTPSHIEYFSCLNVFLLVDSDSANVDTSNQTSVKDQGVVLKDAKDGQENPTSDTTSGLR